MPVPLQFVDTAGRRRKLPLHGPVATRYRLVVAAHIAGAAGEGLTLPRSVRSRRLSPVCSLIGNGERIHEVGFVAGRIKRLSA